MASTAEGLSTPTTDEKVNSEAGFAAALAGKGVEPDAADKAATDTSIALGLETVEPAPGRDPATGKFTPKVETPQPEPDTSHESGQQVTSDDPDVAAFLDKYNGDVEAAVKAAAHQTSLIGRQGNENAELRERLAKMEGTLEGMQSTVSAPATPQIILSEEQVEERASSLISATGGYSTAATTAANESLSGDARVYDSIVEQWALESPIQAQRFDLDFQLWKREQAAPKAAAATSDPWVEDQKAVSGIQSTIKALSVELGPEVWAVVAPKMGDALDAMPPQVAAMVTDDDPAIRLAGTRLVSDRATLLAGVKATPAVENDDAGLPESVLRKLSGASVATAGLRPAPAATQGTITREEAVAAFKQQIVDAETTSVASGLTYGKQ